MQKNRSMTRLFRQVSSYPLGVTTGVVLPAPLKLLSGKVKQPGATALNKRRSQAGYILLCVARPKTDCVIEDGVESHDQLYENPFTGKITQFAADPK